VQSGYTGTAYVDYNYELGETVTWQGEAQATGTHQLDVRYSNAASEDRPLTLLVDGSVVATLPCARTGSSWSTWRTVSVRAPLSAGTNEIQLRAATAAGPNVDHLAVAFVP